MTHKPLPTDADQAETPGGSGGLFAPGIRTTRLLRRALAEQWPVPAKLRRAAIKRMASVIEDAGASHREATAAVAAIEGASRLNLQSIEVAMRVEEHAEMGERLRRLEELAKHNGDNV